MKERILLVTHQIEKKAIIRSSVRSAQVREKLQHGVVLTASGVKERIKVAKAADEDQFLQKRDPAVSGSFEGTIQIDAVSDRALRVRYAEGKTVRENATPMVVGMPILPVPFQCDIRHDAVYLTTKDIKAVVSLDPYRIEVFDVRGKLLCRISGPEKNNFQQWDAVNTGICRDLDGGEPIAAECFDLKHDEHIYGLGEKFIKLNKTGQTIDLYATDGLGVTTPRTYKNIPFYVSDKGYGVFFNHTCPMTYWVGSMSITDIQVAAEDDFLDYYIFTGDIKQILCDYTDLTGRGSVPPLWSFGYWQSKLTYYSAEETLEIARTMRAHEIPFDVLHLDTGWFKEDWRCDLEFGLDRFPDPAAYFREMRALGVKISLWQLPYLPEGSAVFEAIRAVDGFVKNARGEIYNMKGENSEALVGAIDFTNSEAVKIYIDAIKKLFNMGAKVIKTDFGEAAPIDGVYFDGTPGKDMHNLYPLLYNKAVFEATAETSEDGIGVVWARSAWAGSQRYPIHWGGDNSPHYSNIVPQITGGLSLGLSGFQFWSEDIGGFMGNSTDRLLIRWMQFSVFLSHSRIHGTGDRELYKYQRETMEICREYIRLRYRLMPYIYASAVRCVQDSLPMMRALVVEYQDDPNVTEITDQWLFGDGLMVAPICDEGTERRVYLPAGVWTDWWSGERIQGGMWIQARAEIERIPLYIREGAIIPMGPDMQYTGEKKTEKLLIKLSIFRGDGHVCFDVPVNDEIVSIDYTSQGGEHVITVGKTNVGVIFVQHGEGELVIR